MPFVVDASVAASWLLPDENDTVASIAFERLLWDRACVPAIWWFEVHNIFVVNERRGRLTSHQTERALALLAGLPIEIDQAPLQSLIMRIARDHRLSVYDAAYLALALRDGLSLATLDRALLRAADAEHCPTLGIAHRQ